MQHPQENLPMSGSPLSILLSDRSESNDSRLVIVVWLYSGTWLWGRRANDARMEVLRE
jgi:hypothetical protein